MEKYRNTVTSRNNVKSNSPNLIVMASFCEKSNNKSSVMICSFWNDFNFGEPSLKNYSILTKSYCMASEEFYGVFLELDCHCH